jgi:hypothetical protein
MDVNEHERWSNITLRHKLSWGAIEDFILTVKYITAIKAFLL